MSDDDPATNCLRCADCAKSDHHWIEDSGPFAGPDPNPWPCYICKHCETMGAECPRCHADEDRSATCLRCEEEGVVVGTVFLCDGWPVVESGRDRAAEAFHTMFGRIPDKVTDAEIAGRCESCYGLLVEGTDYMTDRDGDGKWCRECGEGDAR